MRNQTITAIKFIIILTIITGVFYPLVITAAGQLFFHSKVNGSIVIRDGKPVGSVLIGQTFDSSRYFWPRPSSIAYNPLPSAGSNLGPTSDSLKKLSEARRIDFIKKNNLPDTVFVPLEMVFASGSGLDPDISPAAALLQADRVAQARKFNENQKKEVLSLIENLTKGPQFLFLGEPRINVFLLNLSLDKIR